MIIGLKDKLEPMLNEPLMKLWEYGLVCSIAIQNKELYKTKSYMIHRVIWYIELYIHIARCTKSKKDI